MHLKKSEFLRKKKNFKFKGGGNFCFKLFYIVAGYFFVLKENWERKMIAGVPLTA